MKLSCARVDLKNKIYDFEKSNYLKAVGDDSKEIVPWI